MTLTEPLISNGHAVRSAPGRPHAGEVSWLPGQLLDRNTAVTAMMLAEAASDAKRDEACGLWPAIQLHPGFHPARDFASLAAEANDSASVIKLIVSALVGLLMPYGDCVAFIKAHLAVATRT